MNNFSKFTPAEKEMILIGLQMRSNYIQTGNVNLNANDAARSGKPELVKPLQIVQMELLVKINNMINDILNS